MKNYFSIIYDEHEEIYRVVFLNGTKLAYDIVAPSTVPNEIRYAISLMAEKHSGQHNFCEVSYEYLLELCNCIRREEAFSENIFEEVSLGLVKKASYHTSEPVDNVSKVVSLIGDILSREATESVFLIHLSNALLPMYIQRVSTGGIKNAEVDTSCIYRSLLHSGAVAFILVHNHTGGLCDVKPSKEDVKLTDKLLQASEIVDIYFADHVIISGDRFYSMREHEYMQPVKISYETDYRNLAWA